jgi:protein TonB
VNPAVPAVTSEAPISQENAVSAVAMSGAEARTDNRWLAESLWRRVAELKRYPSAARLNGQEGKVILKAVIRSDGQLADVVVQKSSGHSVLDEAAIEAVKLACPLYMKQAIGKPQIVVSLPIVYSLAN